MLRLLPAALRASLMVLATLLLAGCGATAEPGSETFYREHAAEARRAAGSVATLQTAVSRLGTAPSGPRLETLSQQVHQTHRALLAAVNWTPAENGEEEGVSQAEKEVHEGAQALLAATGELRLYALKGNPAALAAYRRQLAAGREYWNQGIRELWYVAKRPGAPQI